MPLVGFFLCFIHARNIKTEKKEQYTYPNLHKSGGKKAAERIQLLDPASICCSICLLHCPLLPLNNTMNMKNRAIQHLRLNSTDIHAELTELDTEPDPAQGSNLWMTLTVFLFATGRMKGLEKVSISSFSSRCKQKVLVRYQVSKHDWAAAFQNIHCLTADNWPAKYSQGVCSVQYRQKPLWIRWAST